MNNFGTSCGHGLYPGPTGNVVHAFFWKDETISDLGVLDGFLRSFALDISDKHEIVGYCRTLVNGSDVIRPYVWQNGSMRDLDALVPSLQIPLKIAWGIDAKGRIVAQADSFTYVVTPVFGNAGDANLDCHTNHLDLLDVIDDWGKPDSSADLNSDGIVNVLDLLMVISNWTIE